MTGRGLFKILAKLGLFLATILVPTERGAGQAPSTVKGPEATDLVKTVTGSLVFTDYSRGIVALSLPTLKEAVIWKPSLSRDDMPTIHAVAGPDATGTVAYIEEHFFVRDDRKRRHLLKTIGLDGRPGQEVFGRPGAALFNHVIGDELAMAPIGGRVAFVSDLSGVQMMNPPALLQAGSLELWDLSQKAGRKIGMAALQDGLSWFPDGKRLAYVELVARDKLKEPLPGLGDFGTGFKHWDRVPAVHVFETETRKRTFLHVGWHPVVSSDGKSILVQDSSGRYRLVLAATGESKAVHWPGDRGAVALLEGHRVLYWGLPTAGTKIRYTEHNSPLRGPKLMLTLKLAEIDTQRFQTVVPYIDPRHHVSFGQQK